MSCINIHKFLNRVLSSCMKHAGEDVASGVFHQLQRDRYQRGIICLV
uniref:Uncharacterized protein n=1 Tax=Rhizophora mucronata TaxID=61149 RepID=A0A2P2PDM2_RHIMU